MSYTNVPPDGNFTRLERVIRRQKRLAVINVAATSFLAGGWLLALVAMF